MRVRVLVCACTCVCVYACLCDSEYVKWAEEPLTSAAVTAIQTIASKVPEVRDQRCEGESDTLSVATIVPEC